MLAELTELWSVRLPRRLDPWSPSLADAMADGIWAAGLQRFTAFAPIAAFTVGCLAAPFWPGMEHVYSESLLFMALVIVGAILSGPVGVMLMVGYVCGDLLGARYRVGNYYFGSGADLLFRPTGSRLISYLLLAVPAYKLPPFARRMADSVLWRRPGGTSRSTVMQAGIYAATCGMAVYLWCEAMPVLIRPVFTWLTQQPTSEAIRPLQHQWGWLVSFAVLAAIARVSLKRKARRSSRWVSAALMLRGRRLPTTDVRGSRVRQLPAMVNTGLRALVITLVLAGTYQSWVDPVLVLGVTAGLGLWHAGLGGRLPAAWVRATHGVPALLRFTVILFLGFGVARQILEGMSSESLRPLLLGALTTLIGYYLVFPEAHQNPQQRRVAQ